uniref:Cap1 2'O-ribose methyltransferase 1 n=1 Tax=Globodera pallida TaxID=36090 RepID=A0A183CD65_GLOPA
MFKPIGDSSFMTVETYRRSQSKPKPSADGGAQLSLYFEELRAFTNEAWESDDRKSGILGGVDAIGLHYPHFYAKTFYKILTPPNAFFFKLNKLLRNLSHVNYWVFQTFTLTDAFVEQFMHCVEPKIITNDIRLIRVKRGKAHDRAVRFFFNVVLGNRQILEKLPNAANVMMLNTD